MSSYLCIHGHFYQPPREDPWLGHILAEASAAPMRHWNERIMRESYAPLAWARRLDAEGRIASLLNCYEWMSFNVGPTLLKWVARYYPEVLARLVDADAKSRARWGHGNAIAQIYHHVIMPLAAQEDKELEVRWAIDDFAHYFGRAPEGMWLSECAADLPTLEALANQGIQFVILAPRQARAVVEDGVTTPVNERTLHVGEPYRVRLPSGKNITAVFYHGGISQAIAFEGLLRNGEFFWNRIAGEAESLAVERAEPPLLTIATDGETYGHHFTFGEMALAYVLAQGAGKRDNIRLTNLAAFIAANPPIREALIHEPSSWSCVHGVERWRSDCGCSDGGHGEWHQKWRGPLRDALNYVREEVREHFYTAGKECFTDPAKALMAYGTVLADRGNAAAFSQQWMTGDAENRDKGWKLLAMQEQALASFASCAWFFDDISRIEPENGMTFALRALDYMRETGGPDRTAAFAGLLAKAPSNVAEHGSGKELFEKDVLPRRDDPATLCLLAWLLLQSGMATKLCEGKAISYEWAQISVELTPGTPYENERQSGVAVIRTACEHIGSRYRWELCGPTIERHVGMPFVPLSEARMRVTCENGAEVFERCVSDLSEPMKDGLLSKCLEYWERGIRPEVNAVAAHTASLTTAWVDSQHDVVRPDFWVGFTPYLVHESMVCDFISSKQRKQLEVILSLHLPPRAKTLAQNMVKETLLKELESSEAYTMDEKLATWVQRVRFVMPDMDWWEVQNRVWDFNPERFPLLAKELGFQ